MPLSAEPVSSNRASRASSSPVRACPSTLAGGRRSCFANRSTALDRPGDAVNSARLALNSWTSDTVSSSGDTGSPPPINRREISAIRTGGT